MSRNISDRFSSMRIEADQGWGTEEVEQSPAPVKPVAPAAPVENNTRSDSSNNNNYRNSKPDSYRDDSLGWGEVEETPAPSTRSVSRPQQQQQQQEEEESSGWGRELPRDAPPRRTPPAQEAQEDSGNGWGREYASRESDYAPRRGRDDDHAPRHGRNDDDAPRESDYAPRRGRQQSQQPPADPEQSKQVIDSLFESMNNVNVKLADKQADVNSPLYSVKTFEQLGLSDELLKGIYAMKFVKPSKVQERALPLILSDPPQNMIAQSQSGTGKTAAFVLTMLKRVDPQVAKPQAICITPTRELARQIVDVIRQMGQYTSATTAMVSREEAPRRDPINAHIIVGTPGTLLELERRRLVDLSGIKVFVLDEADVMLDKQGMGLQSMRLRKVCPEECQTLLFSATFSDAVREFAHMVVPNANEISLKREEVSVDSIKQYYIECDNYPHKMEMLSLIYGLLTIGQSIVFIATRDSAEEVKARMCAEGHRVSLIHGGMTPEERDQVIDEFRNGQTKVLLATNVLARGIDVLQVSLVVNFDLPMTVDKLPDPETYIHRIGRTGRFGRKGVAINFVSHATSREALRALESFFGREIIRMPTESIELLEQKLQSISRNETRVPSDVPQGF